MSKTFEINQKVYRKDHGEIVLYQRPDHKNPKWQTRIKIKGSNGYARKSTGTSDEYEARKFADEFYNGLVDKFQATGSTQTKTFKKVVDEWLKVLEKQGRKPELVNEFKMRLYNYPVKFWNNIYIDDLKDSDLTAYIDWRKSNGRHKQTPSSNTIKKDNVPLNLLFKYAFGQKYISHPLIINSIPASRMRRSEFLPAEWNRMPDNLREWAERGKPHPRTYRSRIYLKYYVLILGNTGIRAGSESRSLCWNSLEYNYELAGGKTGILIHIRRGKVGSRKTVAGLSVQTLLKELKDYRVSELERKNKKLNEEECIFCNANGNPIASFKKGFKEFLSAYRMLTHPNGEKRVPYSLRHTYATQRLRAGVSHWDLAKNMGTSVEQLERYYVHDNPDLYGENFIDSHNEGGTLDLTLDYVVPNFDDLLNNGGSGTLDLNNVKVGDFL
jgi:integrase